MKTKINARNDSRERTLTSKKKKKLSRSVLLKNKSVRINATVNLLLLLRGSSVAISVFSARGIKHVLVQVGRHLLFTTKSMSRDRHTLLKRSIITSVRFVVFWEKEFLYVRINALFVLFHTRFLFVVAMFFSTTFQKTKSS